MYSQFTAFMIASTLTSLGAIMIMHLFLTVTCQKQALATGFVIQKNLIVFTAEHVRFLNDEFGNKIMFLYVDCDRLKPGTLVDIKER